MLLAKSRAKAQHYIKSSLRTASCRHLAGRDLDTAACTAVPEFDLRQTDRLRSLVPKNGTQDDKLIGQRRKLSLRKLEALSRALLAVLLAFLHARIASQK